MRLSHILRDFRNFFLLSRPLNVLISVLAFIVACFLAKGHSWSFFTDPRFYATSLTIAGIAASGYWINDAYDFRIDRVNKPKRTIVNALLSVKKVLTVYFVFNFLILACSAFYLAKYHHQYDITFINVLSVVLLFSYASYFKRVSVVGNLLIAFLTSLVIVLAGYLYVINRDLAFMIAFAFQVTLLREITKDIEDIKGDLQFGLRTLPIQMGIRFTKYILGVLYVSFIISTYVPIIVEYVKTGEFLWMYAIASVALVQVPSVYLVWIMYRSGHPRNFSRQSTLLKYLIFGGIVSLFFL
ncbi:MAG: geranylgeranylglycerol-phosphate geranylgeranyltransferase [Bacteroidota bacterium]